MNVSFWHTSTVYKKVILYLIFFVLIIILCGFCPQYFYGVYFHVNMIFLNFMGDAWFRVAFLTSQISLFGCFWVVSIKKHGSLPAEISRLSSPPHFYGNLHFLFDYATPILLNFDPT